MPQTIYTPTKSNRAHAAAKTFRQALAAAAREGFDASALDAADLQDAVGGSAGHGVKLVSSSELDIAHAMLVFNALAGAEDADGVAAFKAELSDALDAIADLPEG